MVWWIALGALSLITAIAGWIRHTFVAITVEGDSMLPALGPGDRVLVRRGSRGVRRHRIIVIASPSPEQGWSRNPPAGRDVDAIDWIIKRVVALEGDPYPPEVNRSGDVPDNHVIVIGDSPYSDDSKQHGPCPTNQILGVVVRRLQRPERPSRSASERPIGGKPHLSNDVEQY